jgi:hypothetical protein
MNTHTEDKSMEDGGPAFPITKRKTEKYADEAGYGRTREVTGLEGGMTLRDYFAAHSVQPGCGEIATVAGLRYSGGAVWSDEVTRVGSFDDWFNGLPLSKRLDLFSRVKFAMADAMLKARKQ